MYVHVCVRIRRVYAVAKVNSVLVTGLRTEFTSPPPLSSPLLRAQSIEHKLEPGAGTEPTVLGVVIGLNSVIGNRIIGVRGGY